MADDNLTKPVTVQMTRIDATLLPPIFSQPYRLYVVQQGTDLGNVAGKANEAGQGAYNAQVKNDEQDLVLADHETRLEAAEVTLVNHEQRIATAEETITNHEIRISENESKLENHEERISHNEKEINILDSRLHAVESSVTKNKYTDGGSLYAYRLKRSKRLLSQVSMLNVAYIGDSWSERNSLPRNMADRLFSDFGGRAGAGWVQFNTDPVNRWENMVVTRSNFTEYDISTASGVPPVYGSGPDGMAYYTARSDATIKVTNIKASQIILYYFDGDGVFRYSIDGAAPTAVAGGGTNTIKKVTINGLANTSQTLDIDTIGNAGTVSITGMYLTSSTSGVVVNKMGNGGSYGAQHLMIQSQIPNYTSELAIDLLIINLGTNDFLQSRGTAQYIEALTTMINTYRAALPNIGVILVSPAQCNATGKYPLTDYRDAMRKVAIDNNVEWYGFYNDMPPVWSVGNALGAWQDSHHLSDIGAVAYTTAIYNYFIKP